MGNPKEDRTSLEMDKNMVGQGQQNSTATNDNPNNQNGVIRYSRNVCYRSINNNNMVNNFKGSITEVRATIGSKTDTKKELFKFFRDKMFQNIMSKYTKGKYLAPVIKLL